MVDSLDRVVHDVTNQLKGRTGSVNSSQLNGKGDYKLLIYGPLLLERDVIKMMGRGDLGGTVVYCNNVQGLQYLLKEAKFDLFVYHISEKRVMSPNPSEFVKSHVKNDDRLPELFEAGSLAYGVGSAYPQQLVNQTQEGFEKDLTDKLSLL
jgi:hypothetical protein